MAEALYYQDGDLLDYTPSADITAGEVIQLADGRAAYSPTAIASGVKGAVQVTGVALVAKTTSMVLLDGGKAFWDHSANKAHYKSVSDRDFFIGSVVGDATSAATTCYVNLNVAPVYKLDLARDAYISDITGTAAALEGSLAFPKRMGGALLFQISATNEAQCVDAMSVEALSYTSNPIVEMAFRVPNGGSTSDVDINIGLASGTSTSDADAITNSLFIHLDGGSANIYAESDNVTAEVNATDTTVDFTAGTTLAVRDEVWMDCRNPADVQIYVNGALVLGSTVFTIDGAANALFLLAHIEKASGTATGDIVVDWLRARTAQQ